MSLIVAGTGHRPDKLGGYSLATFERLVELATVSLKELKPTLVISGMALGWDFAIAQASYDLKLPFVAAVPFEGQESQWPEQSKKQYKALLGVADEIVYVSEPPFTPAKMQLRNEWMVDWADVVLALWNGSPGGTANCVRYAKRMKKQIINVWSRWL